MLARIGRFLYSTAQSVFSEDFLGLSAEMAFYTIFSFFPFLIFVVSLFSIFGSQDLVNSILMHFAPILPSYLHEYIIMMLKEIIINYNGGFLTLTFFISMLIASNAMFAVIKGLNRAYHLEETRPLWYTRLLSVALLFLTALVIFIGTNAIVFGKIIISFIASIKIIPQFTIDLISVFRWPFIFLALYAVFLVNYYFMPNIKHNRKAKFLAALPGTFFFCVAWIVSSWLFSVYLNHINMYNKFFGAMGVFAIFLIWLYYTSFILLLGGEINSKFYRKIKGSKAPLNTII